MVTEALEGFGWEGLGFLVKAEGGKCLFLYALSTWSSSCDLPQHARLQDKRAWHETNLECLAVMRQTVSEHAVSLLLYCSFIVFECGSRFFEHAHSIVVLSFGTELEIVLFVG